MLNNLPEQPKILDIGCGAGMQTIELARICPDGRITAVDIPSRTWMNWPKRREHPGLETGSRRYKASMDDLLFDDAAFDVIWAEGSIFIVGFGEGLRMWKRLFRPGGYVCVTEAVWFTDRPTPEAVTFWNECYPAIRSVTETCAKAENAGYEVVATFPLPGSAWRENYDDPLEERLPDLKKAAAGNPDAEALITFTEREIAMHREHGEDYGYQFSILKSR